MSSSKEAALIPVVLCGGAGSRLWPVSRAQHPKPFIQLDDGVSLLQKAFLRGAKLAGVREVMTVTNRDLFFKIKDEYQSIKGQATEKLTTSYLLEPFGRNTAAAVAAAALQAQARQGDDALLLILAADHVILDQQAFAAAVTEATVLAQQGKLVTFGIQPTSAETGYGYIEYQGNCVKRFVEKPNAERAMQFIRSGNFLWNSGMFCFQVSALLAEMTEHCPALLAQVKACLKASTQSSGDYFSEVELDAALFEQVESDSLDYALMEKTRNASVVACDIGWSDIGCWKALGDLVPSDENNNRVQGEALLKDSSDCTIKAHNRLVGALGVDNLIIVDTADALLVADKSRAQDVKQLYAELKACDHDTHKLHRTVHRPWGTYTILEEGPGFKIKRIEVKPGACLSLQLHHHRSEHWVVVAGVAKALNNEQELILHKDESTFIPAKHKHRLENISDELLVIIEVQTGSYLGEDDIVRFQDVYGRGPLMESVADLVK